jgi:hypothetical protein
VRDEKVLQDEVRVLGDEARELLVAVCVVAGDVERRLLAELHLGDTLVPACYRQRLFF